MRTAEEILKEKFKNNFLDIDYLHLYLEAMQEYCSQMILHNEKKWQKEVEKLNRQVEFFKKAATNLTGTNLILQHAISEFEKYINEQISLCSLAITACGTDEKSAYVHRLYRDKLKDKLKDLDIEKIILEGERLMAVAP